MGEVAVRARSLPDGTQTRLYDLGRMQLDEGIPEAHTFALFGRVPGGLEQEWCLMGLSFALQPDRVDAIFEAIHRDSVADGNMAWFRVKHAIFGQKLAIIADDPKRYAALMYQATEGLTPITVRCLQALPVETARSIREAFRSELKRGRL